MVRCDQIPMTRHMLKALRDVLVVHEVVFVSIDEDASRIAGSWVGGALALQISDCIRQSGQC